MIRTACLLLAIAACLPGAELRLVPTFENASVYLEDTDHPPAALRVRYRASGADTWIDAHPLVATAEHPIPRGSLFGLRPGTTYEVTVSAGNEAVADASVTTWSDEVPIVKTINLAEVNPEGGPYLIEYGGTAEGWVRYVGAPGYVLDGGDRDTEAILAEGVSHVIIEDLTIVGGRRHGIKLFECEYVRIRNCDISGFCRAAAMYDPDQGGKPVTAEGNRINFDGGIFIDGSGAVVVERCYVHDPRTHANSWETSHPSGPTGIFVRATWGTVVRYNDFVASDLLRWNDGIEGWGNGKHGGFKQDADIYGNYFAYANDDGIELDGAQRNVRFYANQIEGGLCGISTAPNAEGPSYVLANLVTGLGDERGRASACIKAGGASTSPGMTFFYHNSFVTPGRGVTGVGFGKDQDRARFAGCTEHNIFATTRQGISDQYHPAGNRYGRDLFANLGGGAGSAYLPGGLPTDAIAADAGLIDPSAGDYAPGPDSPALGAGRAIPGMGWLHGDGSIDLGAVQHGRPVPWRETALRVSPSRIELEAVREHGIAAEPVTLTLDGGALDADVPFTIRRNATCTWITVSPESGVIPAGGSVTLTVALDPATATLERYRGALLVDLGGGVRVPVTVHADIIASELRVVAQAETSTGADAFEGGADEAASGGGFLRFVPEAARKVGERGIELGFAIQQPGTYEAWARIRCPEPLGNHDSMWLSLDGKEFWNCGASAAGGEWRWVTLKRMQLAAGEHSLRFRPREALDLDAVLLTGRPLSAAEQQEKLGESASEQAAPVSE